MGTLAKFGTWSLFSLHLKSPLKRCLERLATVLNFEIVWGTLFALADPSQWWVIMNNCNDVFLETLTVFTKEYVFRNFPKHSESFGNFRRSVARLYNFYLWSWSSNAILGVILPVMWYFWPQTQCKTLKSTKWFRNFPNLSECFGNINPSWKRLLYPCGPEAMANWPETEWQQPDRSGPPH